ncbi:unnamed protein product [Arctogadus glacialis]
MLSLADTGPVAPSNSMEINECQWERYLKGRCLVIMRWLLKSRPQGWKFTGLRGLGKTSLSQANLQEASLYSRSP